MKKHVKTILEKERATLVRWKQQILNDLRYINPRIRQINDVMEGERNEQKTENRGD